MSLKVNCGLRIANLVLSGGLVRRNVPPMEPRGAQGGSYSGDSWSRAQNGEGWLKTLIASGLRAIKVFR